MFAWERCCDDVKCLHTFSLVRTNPTTGESDHINFTPNILVRMDVERYEWKKGAK